MKNEVAPWNEHPAYCRDTVVFHLVTAYQSCRKIEDNAAEVGLTALSDAVLLEGNTLGMALDVLVVEDGIQEWRESAPLNRELVYSLLQFQAREIHKRCRDLQGLTLVREFFLKQIDAYVAAEKMLRDAAGE